MICDKCQQTFYGTEHLYRPLGCGETLCKDCYAKRVLRPEFVSRIYVERRADDLADLMGDDVWEAQELEDEE